MGFFSDRLVLAGGEASLKSDGTPVSELMGRLEAGGPLARLVGHGALAPVDLIAAAAQSALGPDDSLGPSLIQAKPRRPRLLSALSEPSLAGLFPGAAAPSSARARRRSLAGSRFLGRESRRRPAAPTTWESLRSQHTGTASLIAGNPMPGMPPTGFAVFPSIRCFSPCSRRLDPCWKRTATAQLAGSLISGGAWNSSAMIELCTGARSGTPQETLARRLQRLEMWLLLEATFAALAPASRS